MGGNKDIVFICGAKDFHAMDKFRLTSEAVSPRKVILLTDTIQGEGQASLLKEHDVVNYLYIIDKFTFKTQSLYAHLWRNILKILVLPIQVRRLKDFYSQHPDCIYHAVPLYYMLLCYLARVPFIGTPQGSEILVRPQRSTIYRKYAVKTLRAATYVIVDSVSMQNKVEELSGVKAIILKNGFNTDLVMKNSKEKNRFRILSMRGLNANYRIHEIFEARTRCDETYPITLVYPAYDDDYKKKIKIDRIDSDLGRLSRDKLYAIMGETLLTVSIPKSDSSPRSVYESIFAGSCVAATYSPYFDELPSCMKERIYLVDMEDQKWLQNAIDFAKSIVEKPFVPSDKALEMCDQGFAIRKVIREIY